ncbi:MAG: O-antigen ligase family protein [bacterium]|nr:O-antigen ligase family protein [bacterium]
MLYIIYGYLFLFIIRPFDNWDILGAIRLEKMYGLFMLSALAVYRRKRSIRSRQTNAVFALLGAMGLSLAFSYNFAFAWTAFYKHCTLVVFYIVILATLKNESELRGFVIVYIATMALYQLLSLREYLFFGRGSWSGGIWRLTGFDTMYGGPNSFAASIAYSLPFAFGILRSKPGFRVRLAVFGYAALGLACTVLTGSRSGLLTYLLACLLYVGSLPGKRKFLAGFLAVGMLILAWCLVPSEKQARFRTITGEHMNEGEKHSAEDRIRGTGFSTGLRMFVQRPIFGVGMGCFAAYSQEQLGEPRMDAHNLYGELLGQLGIVGTIAFFVLVTITFKNAIFVTREVRRGNVPRASPVAWISWAIIMTLVLLLFEGWASHNLDRYNWLWAAAMAVLARDFVLQRKKAEQPKKVEENREAAQGFLPA